MREHWRRIIDFLTEQGATGIAIEHGGKHPRIEFVWRGNPMHYVVPGTPGDSLRGVDNALSNLRHMLGLVETVKRVGERRERKRRATIRLSAECPAISAMPNSATDRLLSHPNVAPLLPILADIAWLNFWRDCMRSVGGVSRL